jgi:hypothetical protein
MHKLRGGLSTGREALWPSEPHHSPDEATPSCYTKNVSFASGISKMWCVCSDFHQMGVFIGPWGSSTDLAEVVTHQVVAGQPSHVAGGQVERLPPPFSTTSGFSSMCRCVATKARAKPPQTLVGKPLDPLGLGSSSLGPRDKYTPC